MNFFLPTNSFPKYNRPQPSFTKTFKWPIITGEFSFNVIASLWLHETYLDKSSTPKLNLHTPKTLLSLCFKVLQLILKTILTSDKFIRSKFTTSCTESVLK